MPRSSTVWTLSQIQENSAALEQPMRDLLAHILSDAGLSAKFFNMLSMLEHMGSRKIMISQMHQNMSQETLKHLSEETRHAFFFKRQAEKFSNTPLDGYLDENTLVRVPAAMYFGRLDATLSKMIPADAPPEMPYLLVSLIIELRANWLYPKLHEALEESGIPISLKSIIAEEDGHMEEMYDALTQLGAFDTALLQACCRVECDLFDGFFPKLREAVIPHPPAIAGPSLSHRERDTKALAGVG